MLKSLTLQFKALRVDYRRDRILREIQKDGELTSADLVIIIFPFLCNFFFKCLIKLINEDIDYLEHIGVLSFEEEENDLENKEESFESSMFGWPENVGVYVSQELREDIKLTTHLDNWTLNLNVEPASRFLLQVGDLTLAVNVERNFTRLYIILTNCGEKIPLETIREYKEKGMINFVVVSVPQDDIKTLEETGPLGEFIIEVKELKARLYTRNKEIYLSKGVITAESNLKLTGSLDDQLYDLIIEETWVRKKKSPEERDLVVGKYYEITNGVGRSFHYEQYQKEYRVKEEA